MIIFLFLIFLQYIEVSLRRINFKNSIQSINFNMQYNVEIPHKMFSHLNLVITRRIILKYF